MLAAGKDSRRAFSTTPLRARLSRPLQKLSLLWLRHPNGSTQPARVAPTGICRGAIAQEEWIPAARKPKAQSQGARSKTCARSESYPPSVWRAFLAALNRRPFLFEPVFDPEAEPQALTRREPQSRGPPRLTVRMGHLVSRATASGPSRLCQVGSDCIGALLFFDLEPEDGAAMIAGQS